MGRSISDADRQWQAHPGWVRLEQQSQESLLFDQGQERWSIVALKAYALPELYWNGKLRGRM